MAEVATAGQARQLYEVGFEGWDIQEFSYLTDYLVLVVGVVLGFMTYELMKPDKPKVWTLLGQFGLAAFFTGVGYGFAGLAHHMLDTYYEHGLTMGRSVGEPQSEWIYPWLLKALAIPFGAACAAGTSFHFAGVSTGWIKITKGVSLAVSIFELYLTLVKEIDASGTPTLLFCGLTAAGSIVLVLAAGRDDAGKIQILLSNLAKLIGLAITIFAPHSCRSSGYAHQGCPFAEEFNHNSWYHILTAVSLVLCYFGVAAKTKKDNDLAYSKILRTVPSPPRTCCGLA